MRRQIEHYRRHVFESYKSAWDAIARQSGGRIDTFEAGPNSEEVDDVIQWISANAAFPFAWDRNEDFHIMNARFLASPCLVPLNWYKEPERKQVTLAFLVPDGVNEREINFPEVQERAYEIAETAKKRFRVMSIYNDAFQIEIITHARATTPKIRRTAK